VRQELWESEYQLAHIKGELKKKDLVLKDAFVAGWMNKSGARLPQPAGIAKCYSTFQSDKEFEEKRNVDYNAVVALGSAFNWSMQEAVQKKVDDLQKKVNDGSKGGIFQQSRGVTGRDGHSLTDVCR
jgi:hypothetical protein